MRAVLVRDMLCPADSPSGQALIFLINFGYGENLSKISPGWEKCRIYANDLAQNGNYYIGFN